MNTGLSIFTVTNRTKHLEFNWSCPHIKVQLTNLAHQLLDYRITIIPLDAVVGVRYSRRVNLKAFWIGDFGFRIGGGRTTPSWKATGRVAALQLERNMAFYQTNPPFFGGCFGVTCCAGVCCNGKWLENSVGSFWKTNPPGGCFECVFSP